MLDKIKDLLGTQVNHRRSDELNTLVSIPGYEAGKNGNLLVFQDNDLIIAFLERSPGLLFEKSPVVVKPMICTAYIDSRADQAKLEQYVDGNTPTDRVIVVNKKFMSFWTANHIRVTLLEAQSAKSNMVDCVTVLEQATVAEYVAARENHWRSTVDRAFALRDGNLQKQCMRLADAQKRERRKSSGRAWDINPVSRVGNLPQAGTQGQPQAGNA